MVPSPGSRRVQQSRPAIVSVVIPALNAASLLPVQLEALTNQDYEGEWEIVVADNGSTDATANVAASWADRLPLKVVDASGRPGVSYARNVGVRSARGELIAFCDADDEVSPGWLSALVEASLRFDAVGGALDSTKFDNPATSSLYSVTQSSHLRLAAGFLPVAGTGNLSVWADVFDSLGGFKEEYVYGGPDTEFCWRLQLAGYRLGFSQEALVHYRMRGDLRSLARQSYHYGRGGARLYRDFRSAGMPRSSSRSVLRGWAWLAVHLPDLVRDRSRRGKWIRRAAWRLGKVKGSIEYHVLYF